MSRQYVSFTKQDFERKVLDKTNLPYKERGVVKGEYTYLVPIKGRTDVFIYVRSSVRANGQNAGVGEDSIRAHLFVPEFNLHFGKTKKYVQRTNGATTWYERTLDMLRELYGSAMKMEKVKQHNCPECGKIQRFFTAKTAQNKGRVFTKCWDCNAGFSWVGEN